MTTLAPEKRKCFICGTINNYCIVTSTNAFGPCDLDTRPPGMQRNTMPYWIQSCPSCGYVSKRISDRTSVNIKFLESEQYCFCDGITFKSDLARDFYRYHLILLKEGKGEEAFKALLHASWACDDSDDVHNAALVRETAIKLVENLLSGPLAGNDTLSVVCADMMRRASHFQELLEKYKDIRYSADLLNQILDYEKALANRKVSDRRTVQDAITYTTGNKPDQPYI